MLKGRECFISSLRRDARQAPIKHFELSASRFTLSFPLPLTFSFSLIKLCFTTTAENESLWAVSASEDCSLGLALLEDKTKSCFHFLSNLKLQFAARYFCGVRWLQLSCLLASNNLHSFFLESPATKNVQHIVRPENCPIELTFLDGVPCRPWLDAPLFI